MQAWRQVRQPFQPCHPRDAHDQRLAHRWPYWFDAPRPDFTPRARQAALGCLLWLALATIPVWWSFDEVETGNRMFLWALAAMCVLLAMWRGVCAVLIVAKQKQRP